MTFVNRTQPNLRTVGDMTEEDWIALLGSAPTFETVIPQAGGRMFGELTFEDTISAYPLVNRSQPSATFTNRSQPSATFTNRDNP